MFCKSICKKLSGSAVGKQKFAFYWPAFEWSCCDLFCCEAQSKWGGTSLESTFLPEPLGIHLVSPAQTFSSGGTAELLLHLLNTPHYQERKKRSNSPSASSTIPNPKSQNPNKISSFWKKLIIPQNTLQSVLCIMRQQQSLQNKLIKSCSSLHVPEVQQQVQRAGSSLLVQNPTL